jgi:hypothetical protein
MRTGIANLPLHWGATPPWLFERMKLLAREIIYALRCEFGPEEILKRLSDPFWFQSFGCVLGFDWHSSGLTTIVCGALKESVRGLEQDLGLFIVGGKGKTSRKAPDEIISWSDKLSLDDEIAKNLIYASKMSAKVDNTALQDGYQLYHHSFIFTEDGKWAVIQQGMNDKNSMARRYHWLGENVKDFVDEPHSAICCDQKSKTLNLVAHESNKTRDVSTELVRDGIKALCKDLKKLETMEMPRHHDVRVTDFSSKRLEKILYIAHERKPKNFEELLGIEGVGPKTIRALALISELIYGAKPSFRDPARFSFAHGGKDGYPYPVNQRQYDQSIEILKSAVQKAKIGKKEKLEALKKLSS